MLKVLLFSLFIPFNTVVSSIPIVEIENKNILRTLELYKKRIEDLGYRNNEKLHFLIRAETRNKNEIIYVSSTSLISTFLDTPSAYSNYEGHLIFIYSDSIMTKKISFEDFYDKFSQKLEKDITKEKRQNTQFSYRETLHSINWRVVYSNDRLVDNKEVPSFPNGLFRQEYQFDDDGNIRYKDGIFSISSLSEAPFEPEDFYLRTYLSENTSISIEFLFNNIVNAVLVMDKTGKVTDVEIEGVNNEGRINELKRALKNMPAWNPAKLNGKSVKVRFRQRL